MLIVAFFLICLSAVAALLVLPRQSDQLPPSTQSRPDALGAPDGFARFVVRSADHVEGQVSYDQDPPVGGPHAAAWQNCGFYDDPVVAEQAVHSLEHGAVWITHVPNLPAEEVEILRRLTIGRSHVLVSPWPPLDSPVVASAWGNQQRLSSASDPRLAQFLDRFRSGSHAPEPGAPCTGGAGDPK